MTPREKELHETIESAAIQMKAKDDRIKELEEGLSWAMSNISKPTRRISGQNEKHFDKYKEVKNLLR